MGSAETDACEHGMEELLRIQVEDEREIWDFSLLFSFPCLVKSCMSVSVMAPNLRVAWEDFTVRHEYFW